MLTAMARFDRAYIPALALSNQGKLEQTEKSVTRLESEWERFKTDYGSYSGEERWREAFGRVGDVLSEAVMYLEDKELPKVNEVLKEVRDTFVRETMEEVLWIAGEAGSGGFDEARIGKVAALEAEARKRWNALSASPFDPSLFGFDGAKTEELGKAVSAVGKSLDALANALKGKNSQAVIKASFGLRQPYVKTFLMFGDFSGLE